MQTSETEPIPFADLALARRLERTEARSNAEFVEARAKVSPERSARWTEVAGAYALFDGVASPLTQTFGLGIFHEVTRADMQTLETFFRDLGAPAFHEVSPLADPTALALLNDRGYHPIEYTSMLFRPIGPDLELAGARDERIIARPVRDGEHETWAQTAAKGWSEYAWLGNFMNQLGPITASQPNAHAFLAEIDGEPVAAGTMFVHEGMALLSGASTIPQARRRGAQLALLEARLRYAADRGCDVTMMGAVPGSASQRNAERQGFRVAYTRIKWALDTATVGTV